MRFYSLLILVILFFTFVGLCYVRMEMEEPAHPDRLERAQRALESPERGKTPSVKSGPQPADGTRVASSSAQAEPAKPLSAEPRPAEDFTYILIEKIHTPTEVIAEPGVVIDDKPVYTTKPGSLHLRFQGVTTRKVYPVIEAKESAAHLFVVQQEYTREAINTARKPGRATLPAATTARLGVAQPASSAKTSGH